MIWKIAFHHIFAFHNWQCVDSIRSIWEPATWSIDLTCIIGSYMRWIQQNIELARDFRSKTWLKTAMHLEFSILINLLNNKSEQYVNPVYICNDSRSQWSLFRDGSYVHGGLYTIFTKMSEHMHCWYIQWTVDRVSVVRYELFLCGLGCWWQEAPTEFLLKAP